MPNISTGSRSYFAFISEVTPGTTPATPQLTAVPRISDSLNMTRGQVADNSLRPDRAPRNVRLGNKAVGGSVQVAYGPNTFNTLLEAAARNTFTSDVLKFPGTTDKSFTCEIGYTDSSLFRTFTGVRVNTFTLNVPSGNQNVTAEIEVVGENGANGTSTIDAGGGISDATDAQPFVHLDASFEEGGSTIAYVTGVQVKVENQQQPVYVAGSATARGVVAGMAKVTLQITALFESNALFTKFINETLSSFKFTLTSGTSSEEWYFPNIKYISSNIPTGGDGPVVQTVTAEALWDTPTGCVFKVTRVV